MTVAECMCCIYGHIWSLHLLYNSLDAQLTATTNILGFHLTIFDAFWSGRLSIKRLSKG